MVQKDIKMKLEEFNKVMEDIKIVQTDIFNKGLKLLSEGVYDLSKYEEVGINVSVWLRGTLFTKVEERSACIYDMDINYVLDELKEFKQKHKNEEKIGLSEIDIDTDFGDDYIRSIEYVYYFYELKTEKLESEIGRITRDKISDILKPESVEKSIVPDCKMVQLFRDGAIDWKTLQKITYSECNL